SSARAAGPDVRLPSLSYWLLWHGQPKPERPTTGISLIVSPLFECSVAAFESWTRPFGCVGQPRCAQRLEMMEKLGSWRPVFGSLARPLLRTYAVRRVTSPSLGSSRKVVTIHFPSG